MKQDLELTFSSFLRHFEFFVPSAYLRLLYFKSLVGGAQSFNGLKPKILGILTTREERDF